MSATPTNKREGIIYGFTAISIVYSMGKVIDFIREDSFWSMVWASLLLTVFSALLIQFIAIWLVQFSYDLDYAMEELENKHNKKLKELPKDHQYVGHYSEDLHDDTKRTIRLDFEICATEHNCLSDCSQLTEDELGPYCIVLTKSLEKDSEGNPKRNQDCKEGEAELGSRSREFPQKDLSKDGSKSTFES